MLVMGVCCRCIHPLDLQGARYYTWHPAARTQQPTADNQHPTPPHPTQHNPASSTRTFTHGATPIHQEAHRQLTPLAPPKILQSAPKISRLRLLVCNRLISFRRVVVASRGGRDGPGRLEGGWGSGFGVLGLMGGVNSIGHLLSGALWQWCLVVGTSGEADWVGMLL